MLKIILKILLIVLPITNHCYEGSYANNYAHNFFEQRCRGWLWFEEKDRAGTSASRQEELILATRREQEYAIARREVEQFASELEELKFMMIRYPESIEHVRQYKQKEAKMLDSSLKLAHTFRRVNFLYPQDIDLINNPINLYSRRIKEEIDSSLEAQKLKELASHIELFVFLSRDCPYCKALEPVLSRFAQKYGFAVEAVSLDGEASTFFKTHHNPQLVKQLNLQRTGVIMAVTNDSKIRFELARGAVSISELEEAGLLASEYLKDISLNNAKPLDPLDKTTVTNYEN